MGGISNIQPCGRSENQSFHRRTFLDPLWPFLLFCLLDYYGLGKIFCFTFVFLGTVTGHEKFTRRYPGSIAHLPQEGGQKKRKKLLYVSSSLSRAREIWASKRRRLGGLGGDNIVLEQDSRTYPANTIKH